MRACCPPTIRSIEEVALVETLQIQIRYYYREAAGPRRAASNRSRSQIEVERDRADHLHRNAAKLRRAEFPSASGIHRSVFQKWMTRYRARRNYTAALVDRHFNHH